MFFSLLFSLLLSAVSVNGAAVYEYCLKEIASGDWVHKIYIDKIYIPRVSHYSVINTAESFPNQHFQTILKFWLEKGVAGFRLSTINYVFEVDKDAFGDRYPDEPLTGKPSSKPDDYDYLNHIYTKDQNDGYELVSQLREVFDSISVRNNITR